jgi:hypothetical protein
MLTGITITRRARTQASQQRVPQALQLKLLPVARLLLLLLLNVRCCRSEPRPAEGAACRRPGRVAGGSKARQHVQRGQAVHQPPELAVAGQEAVDEVLQSVCSKCVFSLSSSRQLQPGSMHVTLKAAVAS